MNAPLLYALAQDELPEVLRGLGSASPGPLFLVDQIGRSHPLNEMAGRLGDAGSSVMAFVSPVWLGAERVGQVVGYVPETGEEGDAPLVSALVAIAAGVVSRSLGDPADDESLAGGGAEAQQRRAVLEDACARLGGIADEHAVGDLVVTAARAALGAKVAVLLAFRESGDVLEPLAKSGVPEDVLRNVPLGRGFLGWAATRREPTVLASARRMPPSFPRDAGDACVLESWFEPPLVAVPVATGTHVLALICVSGLPRGRGDVGRAAARQLQHLADRAAANLAGARLLTKVRREERVARELDIARQIQSSLLPSRAPDFAGLDVAGECRPAGQVGGDFLEWRETAPGELTAMLFDVAGHGIGAAFCMTLVRSALRAQLCGGTPLTEAMQRANELVWNDLTGSGLFATAFVMRFDRSAGVMNYASAGHARPVHWSGVEHAFVEHAEGGVPLGLLPDAAFPSGSCRLSEGDVVVACTDGILEAGNDEGEKLGRGRLLAVVHRHRRTPARVILRAIWREVESFLDGRSLQDDATVIVVKTRRGFGPGSESTADAAAAAS
jgi:serine phosphatase RsbU (regulator of sigma subunit)